MIVAEAESTEIFFVRSNRKWHSVTWLAKKIVVSISIVASTVNQVPSPIKPEIMPRIKVKVILTRLYELHCIFSVLLRSLP